MQCPKLFVFLIFFLIAKAAVIHFVSPLPVQMQ